MPNVPVHSEQRRFPCGKCGAKLEFAPGTDALRCPYCGAENAITESDGGGAARPPGDDGPARGARGDGGTTPSHADALEQDLATHLRKLADGAPQQTVAVVRCDACGAQVDAPPNLTSFACCFCGSNIVARSRECSIIRVNALLPFRVTGEAATQSFRTWLKRLWWAPNALKRQGMLDAAVKGVYLPAWTYDAIATTRYVGERGDAYYVTVYRTVNGRRVAHQERRIRWSPRSGVVRDDFDDVLVLASSSLPRAKVEELTPWDLKEVQPYREEYLAGFTAERYQLPLDEGFQEAVRRMQPTIEATIRAGIGGDEQRIHRKDSNYSEVTFKHLLLPIWVSAYRFKGRVFRFLVNARTGEVQGERPYSAWKIGLAILGGLVLIAILVAIFGATRR
jgi:DNA-directed RNA polymerase subunit RPC12/RpoP